MAKRKKRKKKETKRQKEIRLYKARIQQAKKQGYNPFELDLSKATTKQIMKERGARLRPLYFVNGNYVDSATGKIISNPSGEHRVIAPPKKIDIVFDNLSALIEKYQKVVDEIISYTYKEKRDREEGNTWLKADGIDNANQIIRLLRSVKSEKEIIAIGKAIEQNGDDLYRAISGAIFASSDYRMQSNFEYVMDILNINGNFEFLNDLNGNFINED